MNEKVNHIYHYLFYKKDHGQIKINFYYISNDFVDQQKLKEFF